MTSTTLTRLTAISLATYRLTRLAIEDEITEDIRNIARKYAESSPKLTYLLSCPWCISIYAAVLAVLVEKAVPELNTVLAGSSVTGLIYNYLG